MNVHEPRRWEVPAEALVLSHAEMRIDGVMGNEGTALWLGRRIDGAAIVSHVACLRGPGIHKEPDLIHISTDLFNEVADIASDLGVYIVGQIHSHGIGYLLDLSPTDRRHGIRVAGFLSIVAPDYCLNGHLDIHNCGVHVCGQDGVFRRLTIGESKSRIVVTNSAVARIEVGR